LYFPSVSIWAEMRIVRERERRGRKQFQNSVGRHTHLFRYENALTQQVRNHEPGPLLAALQALPGDNAPQLPGLHLKLMGYNCTAQTTDLLVDHPQYRFKLAPPQPTLLRRGVLKIPEELDDVPQVKAYGCNLFAL